jgi:hypothetical protein
MKGRIQGLFISVLLSVRLKRQESIPYNTVSGTMALAMRLTERVSLAS